MRADIYAKCVTKEKQERQAPLLIKIGWEGIKAAIATIIK